MRYLVAIQNRLGLTRLASVRHYEAATPEEAAEMYYDGMSRADVDLFVAPCPECFTVYIRDERVDYCDMYGSQEPA